TVAGGLLNLPAFAGGHEGLAHWLEPGLKTALQKVPLVPVEGRTETLLIAGAVIVALAGLLLGWRATLARPIPVAREAPAERGFARVLFHKYYIDELYRAVIVRPLVGISRWILWKGVDQGLVDGAAVNGSAAFMRGLGWLGSRLQSGQLGVYVVIFLIGAVWLLRALAR
ncbi:MAG TPA: hypothetical protein VL241_00725, partial [Gemmatimonadales bacterium]|nr:hypothetical protein [Gemmatimonadales bacterium]